MAISDQAVNTITQGANTTANITIQAATLLGLALSKKDFELVQEWKDHGYIPDSTFIIPSEKMFEFRLMADVNGIEFAELPGQDYEKDEFIQIITKGPKASEQILDSYGNVIGVNDGFEGDRPIVEKLANQVITEYRASHNLVPDRTDELGNDDLIDNELNSGEAQKAFKNAKTVRIQELTRSEMELLTKHADSMGIDTFVRYDYVADQYSVELSQNSILRNPNTPDIQSPGERLLQDYLIVSSHPKVASIMELQDKTYNSIRSEIARFQKGELDHDMVLTSFSDLKPGISPSKYIIMHTNGYAEVLEKKPSTDEIYLPESYRSHTFNLRTKEGLELFYEKYKSMTSVKLIDFNDFDQITRADISDQNDFEVASSLLKGYKSDYQGEFSDEIPLSGLKASIYRQTELLSKDGFINLHVSESSENSFQTIEQRVPNSDTVITDTILSSTRDKSDEMIEEMKKLLDLRMESMKVTNASMFESIPSYMLKDQGELLQEQRILSVEAGQSQGLTVSEANLYANAIELFQDKANDGQNPMVNSHTPIILVDTQVSSDGTELYNFSASSKANICLDRNGNEFIDTVNQSDNFVSREKNYNNSHDFDNEISDEFDYSDHLSDINN